MSVISMGTSVLGRSAAMASKSWCLSAARAASRFASVPEAPKDPILGVTEKFLADTNPNKMNLGVVSAYFNYSAFPLKFER